MQVFLVKEVSHPGPMAICMRSEDKLIESVDEYANLFFRVLGWVNRVDAIDHRVPQRWQGVRGIAMVANAYTDHQ